MGSAVSVIFCLIGFVVVIPNAGAFGILWNGVWNGSTTCTINGW